MAIFKRKDEKLNQIMKQYHNMLQSYDAGSLVCEAEGDILFANETLYTLLACTADEVISSNLYRLLKVKGEEALLYNSRLYNNDIVKFKTEYQNDSAGNKHLEVTLIPILINQQMEGIFVTIFDRTDYINLEHSMIELQENISYAQKIASIGSWTYDLKNGKLFLSEGIYQILESTIELLTNDSAFINQFVHPDDLSRVKEGRYEALKGLEFSIEYRILTKDGKLKYVHEKAASISDEQENPIKIIGVLQDVTSHKLIQAELKDFNDDLNIVQRVAGVGSWRHDSVNDIITLSDEVYKIYRVDPLSFNKDFESFLNLVHPEDREKTKSTVEACYTGKSYDIEHRLLTDDGTCRYISAKGEPIYDEGGKVVGITGTVQDITDYKSLEFELNRLNKNMLQAQSLAHIGSWEMDLVSGKNFMTDEVNKIYGINNGQSDWTFTGFMKFVHPEDRSKVQNVLRNPTNNKPFGMEFRIVRADGEIRNVYQLMEITYNNEGKAIYIYGTIQDITEKTELEKKLLDTEKDMNDIRLDHRRKIDYIANHDDITKLPNRRSLRNRLNSLCQETKLKGSRFALIMLETDANRNIKYSLDYQLSDFLSIEIAERLKDITGDDNLYQYSNSEYAIILHDTERIKDYDNYANKLINLFTSPFKTDNYEIYINVNIGISIFPEDGKDSLTLKNHADTALAKAIASGKNSYQFHTSNLDIEH